MDGGAEAQIDGNARVSRIHMANANFLSRLIVYMWLRFNNTPAPSCAQHSPPQFIAIILDTAISVRPIKVENGQQAVQGPLLHGDTTIFGQESTVRSTCG